MPNNKVAEPLVLLQDDATSHDLQQFKENDVKIRELKAQVAELESQQEVLRGRLLPVLKQAENQMVRIGGIVFKYTKSKYTSTAWKKAFDSAIQEINATAAKVVTDAFAEMTKVTEKEDIKMTVGGRQAGPLDFLKGVWSRLSNMFRGLVASLSNAADELEALGEPPTDEGAQASKLNPMAAMDEASATAANSFLTDYREHKAKVAARAKVNRWAGPVGTVGLRAIKRTRFGE